MKRRIAALLAGLLCLALAGCTARAPSQTADGGAWDSDWKTIGGALGVDAPAGVTLRDDNDLMAINNICYAAWSMGPEHSYTDEAGEQKKVYDAQISLLLFQGMDAEEAEESARGWQTLAVDRYQPEGEAVVQDYQGQPYTVQSYTVQTPTNPYETAAAAFGVRGNYAFCIEVSCRNDLADQAMQVLEDFLNSLHYAV